MAKNTNVVKMGRPPVFTGALKANIVKVIGKLGLMRGREHLATVGVQSAPGKPKKKVKISLPTLGKFAVEAGIELKRGRPALAA